MSTFLNRLSQHGRRHIGQRILHNSIRYATCTTTESINKDLHMTSLSMEENDRELFTLINNEVTRQKGCINLSPLENYTSRATLDTIQTVLQNKYSEGYPRARYYGGNENVDDAEELCQERALKLFNLDNKEWSVNVQSLSNAVSNLEALTAMVSPNSRVLTLDGKNGGDVTLGGNNASALHSFFNIMYYNTNKETQLIDYNKLNEITNYIKPDIILTGNGNNSGYPRVWDWKLLSNICQSSTNANNETTLLMCDISDTAGLIATGHYPSPFEFCDIVTCATNTSLRGPKGAAIMFFRQKYAQQVDGAVFPGHQGGPHNHAISALATSLLQAKSEDFNHYQTRALDNATEFGNELEKKGYKLLTNGTDTTTVIIDKNESSNVDCANCDSNNIHVLYDNDSNTVRMSTLAMTTRGLNSNDFKIVANLFDEAANGNSVQDKVSQFVEKFPLPGVDIVN